MGRFRKSRPEDTVRAAWWDAGTLPDGTPWEESATFKPRFSEAMVQERAAVLDGQLAELRRKAETRGISEQARAEMETRLDLLLTLYAALDSWTFREDPTPDQEAAGEPGDIADLTPATLAELDAADLSYLMQALMARAPKVEAAPSPSGFRPGRTTDAAVHAGQRVRGRGRPAGTSDAARGDRDREDRVDLRGV